MSSLRGSTGSLNEPLLHSDRPVGLDSSSSSLSASLEPQLESDRPSADGDGVTFEELEVSVAWFELFYDLVFVAVIHNIAGELEHRSTLSSRVLLKYTLRIFLAWWLWHITVMGFNMKAGKKATRADNFSILAVMACVALMSSAASAGNDGNFLKFFMAACCVAVAWQFSTWRALRAESLRPGATRAQLDSVEQWANLSKGMLGILVITGTLLIPAAVTADEQLCLALWGAFTLFVVWARTVGGYIGRNKRTDFIAKGHLEERYELLTLILLGEVVGAAALAKPPAGAHTWSGYGCVVGALLSAWACGKLCFGVAPAGFQHPTRIDSLRNISAVHCFPVMACSLAALAAGYARTIEYSHKESAAAAAAAAGGEGAGGEGEGEGADGEGAGAAAMTAVTALRLVVLPTAVFLISSAPRVSLGRDSLATPPRLTCGERAAVRAAVGGVLIALCLVISDGVHPSGWCLITPAVVLVGVAFEEWGCGCGHRQQSTDEPA